jgi:hypothetical protein
MAKSKYADIHRECKAETQNQIPNGPKKNLRKMKLQTNAEGYLLNKINPRRLINACQW